MPKTERRNFLLNFEKPLCELEARIEQIRELAAENQVDVSEEIALERNRKRRKKAKETDKMISDRHRESRNKTRKRRQRLVHFLVKICGKVGLARLKDC